MFKNFIKIAFRNIFRNKVYAAINIAGLAMGIAAFLLLAEYISLEKSVNQFHKSLSGMYRLINEDAAGKTWPEQEPGWALQARQRFPELKEYCRFADDVAKGIVSKNDNSKQAYRENQIGYAEGNFFNFFSFPLKQGSPADFNKTNTCFMSASAAKKYFGDTDPIGKTLTLNNQFGAALYTVEGVYADMGNNSDIHYDMVFSLETLKNPANLNDNDWARLDNLSSQYINTYFELNEGVNAASFEKKLTAMRNELKKDKDGVQFHLQAFSAVHLGSSLSDRYLTYGNLKYVYMLGAIAFLILLIAWFNYINLSTANSIKRAGEVGIRKAIGASRQSLVAQFMGESVLINLIGFTVAIALVILIQPLFNQLINKTISLQTLGTTKTWLFALALLVAGSVFSGAYTAFSLSRYNPIDTLKGKIGSTAKGIFLRKSLVVAQFVISIVLIIATILIYTQLSYMKNQQLGINTSQLLVIQGPETGKDSTFKNRRSAFWDELSQQSFIKDYATSGAVPSKGYNFATSGFTQPNSKKGDELKTYAFAIIGDRFLKAYDIGLVAGRNFTAAECNVEWNSNSKVLMNETAVKQLGFQNPEDILHTKIQWDERALDVVGVVKDYHHKSLQNAIDPIIFYPQNNSTYFTVRLTADKMQDKMAFLEKLYKKSFSGNPFEFFFVDDNYNKSYLSEKQYGDMFSSAAIWAIFIACLGLFGLTTFTVESRIKEIGVRKVLGASVQSIVSLLSKDFLLLVLIALLIATPVAWYFMHQWLQDFAYRIDIGWWVFALAGCIAVAIALSTVFYQAVKAAITNPVKSLKAD
ncbi:MAG: transporter permease [Ferruginibacter sp.]|uniref:ABC transporter permease n=1 Tax=Ferruginibacter sp. TaxID=1940288 RepID=UPI002659AAEA|nr:ABC transporter permease [Ferruginibacter sp.]MDB5279820.1 transporter permease [Ferruginibacter sp.]